MTESVLRGTIRCWGNDFEVGYTGILQTPKKRRLPALLPSDTNALEAVVE